MNFEMQMYALEQLQTVLLAWSPEWRGKHPPKSRGGYLEHIVLIIRFVLR